MQLICSQLRKQILRKSLLLTCDDAAFVLEVREVLAVLMMHAILVLPGEAFGVRGSPKLHPILPAFPPSPLIPPSNKR